MIDKQPSPTPARTGIPFISDILHVASMPILVLFRYGFGYSYLRPKSIFLALAWAIFLMSYIVRQESALHPQFGALAAFLSLAAAFYLLHLAWSFFKETRSKGALDQFSGHSYLLIPLAGAAARGSTELKVHMLAEPSLAILAGLAVWVMVSNPLGLLLCASGAALFLKEAINAWLTKRRKKLITDKLKEAEGSIEQPPQAPPPTSSRKPRTRRSRNRGDAEDEAT